MCVQCSWRHYLTLSPGLFCFSVSPRSHASFSASSPASPLHVSTKQTTREYMHALYVTQHAALSPASPFFPSPFSNYNSLQTRAPLCHRPPILHTVDCVPGTCLPMYLNARSAHFSVCEGDGGQNPTSDEHISANSPTKQIERRAYLPGLR